MMLKSSWRDSFRVPLAVLSVAALLAAAGCGSPPPEFELNLVHLKTEEQNGRLTEVQLQELADALEGLFGTPNNPRVPSVEGVDTTRIINPEYLERAAGPVSSDQVGRERGLYRKHCVHCHGITGDGAGPTAAFLNPYPRDYRPGIFKFKSTPGITPPTHDDLKRILVNGVNGTSMPSFRLLDDDELEALVHYVRYLAIRGRVERNLITLNVSELDPDMHLLNFALAQTDPEEFQEQLGYVLDEVTAEFERWQDVDSQVQPVPEPPAVWSAEWHPGQLPPLVVQTTDDEVRTGQLIARDDQKLVMETVSGEEVEIPVEEVRREGASWAAFAKDGSFHAGLKLQQEDGKLAYLDSTTGEEKSVAVDEIVEQGEPMELMVAHGRRLFHGNVANCAQCHGTLALGDGQVTDYDEWTSSWTVKNTPPLDPNKNIVRLNEYLELGALRPRNIRPRNLRMGIYRGGRRPVDIYLRVMNGIAGTPMPAASKQLTENDLWSIVAYVRSLPYQPLSQPPELADFQRERQ